jgi:hypothetical protein
MTKQKKGKAQKFSKIFMGGLETRYKTIFL